MKLLRNRKALEKKYKNDYKRLIENSFEICDTFFESDFAFIKWEYVDLMCKCKGKHVKMYLDTQYLKNPQYPTKPIMNLYFCTKDVNSAWHPDRWFEELPEHFRTRSALPTIRVEVNEFGYVKLSIAFKHGLSKWINRQTDCCGGCKCDGTTPRESGMHYY